MKSNLKIIAALNLISTAIILTLYQGASVRRRENVVKNTYGSNGECFDLRGYLKWHEKNRNRRVKRVIFRKMIGGIGDNIRAFIDVFWFAYKTNRLVLFDITRPLPLSNALSEKSIQSFVYKKNDEWDRDSDTTTIEDIDRLIYELKSNVTTVYTRKGPPVAPWIEGYSQSKDLYQLDNTLGCTLTEERRREIARIVFEPSQELVQLRNTMMITAGLCVHGEECAVDSGKTYYGIHARLGGDTFENTRSRFSRLFQNMDPIGDCFLDKVRTISKEENDMNPAVFLASDTVEFKSKFTEKFEKEFKNGILLSLNQSIMHYNKIPKNSDAGMQTFLGQHLEMLTLGGAKQIISLWSGFSKSAYLKGEATQYTLLDFDSCLKQVDK